MNARDVLEVGEVSALDLVQAYGCLLFALSEAAMRSNYLRIHKALSERYPTDVVVSAGMKGNAGFVVRCVIVEDFVGFFSSLSLTTLFHFVVG